MELTFINVFLTATVLLSTFILLFSIVSPKHYEFRKLHVLHFILILYTGLYGIFLAAFTNTKREDLNYYCGRFMKVRTKRWLGIEHVVVNTHDLDKRYQPCVYMLNHQSSFDMTSVAEFIPRNTAIIAKESLLYVPILGFYIKVAKNIFINRGNLEKAIASLNLAAKQIKDRKAGVMIFPEGTRSRSEVATLLPFKKGGFNLAIAAQVPIVPVVISNQSHFIKRKEKEITPSRIITLKVLDPIPTKGLTRDNINELTEKVRSVMLKEIVEMDKKDIEKYKKLENVKNNNGNQNAKSQSKNNNGTTKSKKSNKNQKKNKK